MRNGRRTYFLLFACFIVGHASASSAPGVAARAFADTTTLRIGEQFKLNLEFTAPSQYKVQFPIFADTLNAFEIAGKSRIDTVDNKNNTFTYRQQLQLTRFDSGFYVIQPITFYYKDLKGSAFDSVQTEAMLLTVQTIPVDTTHAIKDIKPVVDLPLTFGEILPYLLLVLALALAGYFLYRYLKSRKTIPEISMPKTPVIPPYETALSALKELAEEKLWQQGLFKHFHTRIADIVRTYIENSFGILAMEQTTDEILLQLKGRTMKEEARDKLSQILRLADLVKFAKVQPVSTENETSLAHARDFVMLTKPVTEQDTKETEVSA